MCPKNDNDLLRVEKGQHLFDLEGKEGGSFHSRKAHLPPGEKSGITIGRGYDLGQHPRLNNESVINYKQRSRPFVNQVTNDFRAAGIGDDVTNRYLDALGLRKDAAKNFLAKGTLPEISLQQQKSLFEISYKRYETITRAKIGSDFNGLTPSQQEALVSLCYNSPALLGSNLKNYIHNRDWSGAVAEIRERSNRTHDRGIQKRRESEAKLFIRDLNLPNVVNRTPATTEDILNRLGVPSDKTQEVVDACRKQMPGITNENLNSILATAISDVPDIAIDNEVSDPVPDNDGSKLNSASQGDNSRTNVGNTIILWADKLNEAAPTLRLVADIADRVIGGNSSIARKVVETTLLVAQGASAVALLLTATSIGSAVGPVGTLIGVLVGIGGIIFGSGSEGPNATTLMMERLEQLSDQISDFRQSVDQQFKENRQMQLTILTTLNYGFAALTQEVRDQVISSRLDTNARLDEIRSLLTGVLNLLQNNSQLSALRDFNDLCAESVQRLKGTVTGDPKDLNSRLARWIETHSSNALFNGENISFANQATIADFLLNQVSQNSSLLITVLAYLAHVYTTHQGKGPINAAQLPNMEIWYRGVTHYAELKQDARFLPYDIEKWQIELEDLRKVGNRVTSFSDAVDADTEFWQNMINTYNQLLQNVNVAKNDYVAAVNAKKASDLANAFTAKNPINHQAALAVGSLNFFNNPDNAVALFNNRGLGVLANGFQGEITQGFGHIPGAPGRDDSREETRAVRPLNNNLKPWSRTGLAPSEYLLAEYLQLVYFSASLNGSIPIPRTESAVYGNLDYWANAIRRRNGRDDFVYDGDTIIENVGMEFFTDHVTQWRLPVVLQVMRAGAVSQSMQFSFIGSYEALVAHGAHIWNRPYNWAAPANDANAFHNRVMSIIPAYISQQWERADASLAVEGVSPIPTNSVRPLIEAEFLNFRRNVATELHTGASTNHQDKMNIFNVALRELDLHVKHMQLFLHLAGRDIKHNLVNSLITSNTIKADLTAFQARGIEHTDLLPSLTQALQDVLCAAYPLSDQILERNLFDIPHIDFSTDPWHPLNLCARGMTALSAYESTKKIYDSQQQALNILRNEIAIAERQKTEIDNAILDLDEAIQLANEIEEDTSAMRESLLSLQQESSTITAKIASLHQQWDFSVNPPVLIMPYAAANTSSSAKSDFASARPARAADASKSNITKQTYSSVASTSSSVPQSATLVRPTPTAAAPSLSSGVRQTRSTTTKASAAAAQNSASINSVPAAAPSSSNEVRQTRSVTAKASTSAPQSSTAALQEQSSGEPARAPSVRELAATYTATSASAMTSSSNLFAGQQSNRGKGRRFGQTTTVPVASNPPKKTT